MNTFSRYLAKIEDKFAWYRFIQRIEKVPPRRKTATPSFYGPLLWSLLIVCVFIYVLLITHYISKGA